MRKMKKLVKKVKKIVKKEKKGIFSKVKCSVLSFLCERIDSKCANKGFWPEFQLGVKRGLCPLSWRVFLLPSLEAI